MCNICIIQKLYIHVMRNFLKLIIQGDRRQKMLHVHKISFASSCPLRGSISKNCKLKEEFKIKKKETYVNFRLFAVFP